VSVCVLVCVFVCICVFVCVCLNVWVWLSVSVCVFVCVWMHVGVGEYVCVCVSVGLHRLTHGVALVSKIDKIIGLFCKRALEKRRYSAKATYNFIDPINRSHPICIYVCERINIHTYMHVYSCIPCGTIKRGRPLF